MKKLLLLISMAFALIVAHHTAVQAATVTDTWSFDKAPAGAGDIYLNMDNYQDYFPAGMELSSTDKWGWKSVTSQGVDGGRCLQTGANSIKKENVIVFYAHKGTLAFNVKQRFAAPTLVIWTATKEGDSWQVGTEILNAELSEIGSTFSSKTVEIENDGYVAFTAINAYINDIANTYEASASAFSVSGTVKDIAGAPVADATVSILSSTVQTDAEGNFVIGNIADGEYEVSVSKAGYNVAKKQVVVSGADVSGVEVTMEKTITVVKGRVNDEITYEAIVGPVTVTFMNADNETVAEAVMDGANYTVTLEGELLSSYKVKVAPRFYKEVTYTYSVSAVGGENTRNWLVSRKKISFNLTLKNTVGLPLSGATVTITRKDNGTAETAAETGVGTGVYAISNQNAFVYADYTYVLNVTMPDYNSPAPVEFQFDGESYTREMTLNPVGPTVISGKVADEDGEPVAEATVMLNDSNSPMPIATVTTDEEGLYSIEIEGEPAESYTITVNADFYESYTGNVADIAASQTNTFDVTLKADKYTFTAFVVDTDNNAITNAVVKVSEGSNSYDAVADGNGAYAFTIAAAKSFGRTYTVNVEAEGYRKADAYRFSFSGQDESHMFTLVSSLVSVSEIISEEMMRRGAEIFTVTGIRVNAGSTESLPAGIYIVGGKKISVR